MTHFKIETPHFDFETTHFKIETPHLDFETTHFKFETPLFEFETPHFKFEMTHFEFEKKIIYLLDNTLVKNFPEKAGNRLKMIGRYDSIKTKKP